jgi:hypothetical protein
MQQGSAGWGAKGGGGHRNAGTNGELDGNLFEHNYLLVETWGSLPPPSHRDTLVDMVVRGDRIRQLGD